MKDEDAIKMRIGELVLERDLLESPFQGASELQSAIDALAWVVNGDLSRNGRA